MAEMETLKSIFCEIFPESRPFQKANKGCKNNFQTWKWTYKLKITKYVSNHSYLLDSTIFGLHKKADAKKNFTRITKRLEIAMSWGMMFQHENILQDEQGAISAVDWTHSTEISFDLDKDLRGIE